MKAAASTLFGLPDLIHARPNTFGELMRAIISPSRSVQEAVQWALKGADPDIVLHMRMMMNRYIELYLLSLHKLMVPVVIVHVLFLNISNVIEY